ncbi:uracil-DNA glycosylase [Peribacillus acanthi]|uniref:uracil-DNA glycosylase n=1 Tax=Peribacillus acanthi TaxID=2171554 RepID=UPI00130057B2|nr:uracil-DNA glycosylase [Peribacillus acanthi]
MINHFARLKEISDTVIPYEIRLLTNYDGWEDSIDLRGKNLKLSIIDEVSEFDYTLKLSDERGLTVTIPCDGLEIINEYRNGDECFVEFYFYVYEGVAVLTIKGKEITINNTAKDIKFSTLISQAKNCPLCDAMKDKEAVIGYQNGNLNADIMFIAEAPGPHGANVSGIPLHGDITGNNFEKLLSTTNWTRSDVFITNAVLCCPTAENGNVRPPNHSEVRNCSSHLANIIDLVNPKIVVTLGQKALEALKIIENHQLILNKDVASYTKWNNRWLYPLYHPSPKVIHTRIRNYEQQKIDFKQLAH